MTSDIIAKRILFTFFIFLLLSNIKSQTNSLNTKITLSKQYYSISQLFNLLIVEYEINLSYDSELETINNNIEFSKSEYTIENILNEIENQCPEIDFIIRGSSIVAKKKKIIKKFTISGYVKSVSDGEALIGASIYNKEALIGASIYNKEALIGTTANNYGFYSLTLPQGNVCIICSYLGFNDIKVEINLQKDTLIIFELEESSANIDEVTIEVSKSKNLAKATQMSTISIPLNTLTSMPSLMGETDILKVAQLTPGIKSGNEISGNIYVRGGGADQNLILLDGVTIYNPSHMLGLVSFFNTSSINNMEVIKGGFPARYGGRLSSVVDIAMKEGNDKEFEGEASIGILMSKLTMEGPLKKGKSSYLISARRTYWDVLARPFIVTPANKIGYHVSDINVKINHSFSNNRIFYSFFLGDEEGFGDGSQTYNVNGIDVSQNDYYGMRWTNMMSALRWNHIFSNKLFSNTIFSFSGYRFNVLKEYRTSSSNKSFINSYEKINHTSKIGNFQLKTDFYYSFNPLHTIRFGFEGKQQYFYPAVYELSNLELNDSVFGVNKTSTNDVAIYAEDDFDIAKRIKLNLGIRYTFLLDDKKVIPIFEPRISGRYLLTNDLSCKLSYTRMSQYLHMLTHFGYGVPTEIWVPATNLVKPVNSEQVAIGFAYFHKHQIEISIESYYKDMQNVIDFSRGSDLHSLDENWQENVEIGNGRSYGVELFVQKKTGNTTGWIGYTLSKTDRQFDKLYNGQRFPYRYDRRHDVSIVLQQSFKKRHKISATWIYGTGNSVTIPLETYNAKYWVDGGELEVYSDKNSFKMRSYHRLDLSVMFNKQKKHGMRTLTFSAFNAYNRKNPIFISYELSDRNFTEYQLLPIIPSFSYTFKF